MAMPCLITLRVLGSKKCSRTLNDGTDMCRRFSDSLLGVCDR